MRNKLALVLAAVLMLTGCGSAAAATTAAAKEETTAAVVKEETTSAAVKEETTSAAAKEETPGEAANAGTDSKTDKLILYFSRTGEQYTVGVIEHGNTAIVAEMIAEKTGGDLFEILPADDHYPMTYQELTDVAKREQKDKARPAYKGELPDLSKYSTVFIGAPVWWGDWPMIMYTVFENNDFSGKTLIPFSTHEGSGLSGFDKKLQAACEGAAVGKGLAIRGNDAQNAQDKVRGTVNGWLTELGLQ